MKKSLILLTFFIFLGFIANAQHFNSRNSKKQENYTGKRFDSYGKPLKQQNKPKKKVEGDKYYSGEYKNKSYPIGRDKDKKRKKSNYKGKKKKKDCNCPGH